MITRSLKFCLPFIALLTLCLPTFAQQRPAFDPLLQRAEKALAAKDLETAVILFEKLAGFYPDSSVAHDRLGYAHYVLGNDLRAIYSFRKALALSRNNDQALHNLLLASGRQADSLARENAFTEAEKELDELIASYSWHPQHAVLLYYRGRMEFLRGRPEEGLKWWKKAAAQAPNSGVAKVIAAQARPLNKETIDLYRAASEKVKTEPAFDYLLGKRQLEANQFEPAYQNLSKAMLESKQAKLPFPLLSVTLAQAALATNRHEEAIQILEQAKIQRPDWASIRTLLWPAYSAVGNSALADQALQESFELNPEPKLALLGTSQPPVRMKTANGSMLLVAPTAVSLPAGTITLLPKDGTTTSVEVAKNQAIVFAISNNMLEEKSKATLASNTGNAGQLAPPLVAKDRRGRLYRLAESLLKKPIVILFWDVTDSDSAAQLSHLGAVASRLGEGVETVAIHTDPERQKDAQRLYLSQPGTSAQLWGDLKIASEFGVTASPALIVIDKNGRVTMSRTGGAEQMFSELALYIESL